MPKFIKLTQHTPEKSLHINPEHIVSLSYSDAYNIDGAVVQTVDGKSYTVKERLPFIFNALKYLVD